MTTGYFTSRRNFLKASLVGGAAAVMGWHLPSAQTAPAASAATSAATGKFTSRVALTTGDDRANLAFKALQPFKKEIAAAIGNKRVIIKPNLVRLNMPLAVNHADNLEGILEFLKSIGKRDITIAESPAEGAAFDAFAGYGYNKFVGNYGVKLVDLDQEAYRYDFCIDERDGQPHPRRASKLLYDPGNFIISAAVMKTHMLAGVTLSLKNLVIASGIKDRGASFISGHSAPGTKSDKPIAHGGGTYGINYNLYALSEKLHPHLAVIDGYQGMEGDGPEIGTPVDHKVCLASLDWLAADCVGTTLMGIDVSDIGYLTYCIRAGRGEGDPGKTEIVGPPIKDLARSYKRPKNWKQITSWQQPLKPGAAA
jgi:uncharacterized protein (DUF362 family)